MKTPLDLLLAHADPVMFLAVVVLATMLGTLASESCAPPPGPPVHVSAP